MVKATKSKRGMRQQVHPKKLMSKARNIVDQRKWDNHFKQLKAYKRKHGNCDVPKRYPPNPQLGQWVQMQRKNYKKGKLSDDRIEWLEGLGFKWDCPTMSEARINADQQKWNEHFKDLKAYKRKHGNCDVPQRYLPNPQLRKWVDNQRSRKEQLSEDRVQRLEELEFNWGRTNLSWEERFKELKSYQRKHGHCSVPKQYAANPQLAIWVDTQRVSHKKGKISDERAECLEELGFQWGRAHVRDVEPSSSTRTTRKRESVRQNIVGAPSKGAETQSLDVLISPG